MAERTCVTFASFVRFPPSRPSHPHFEQQDFLLAGTGQINDQKPLMEVSTGGFPRYMLSEGRIYIDRIAGGYRNHRGSRCDAVTCALQGEAASHFGQL